MKNVLVPIDFSTASHNAGKYAVSLAKIFNAQLTMIYVFMPPLITDDSVAASMLVSYSELAESYQASMDREIKALSKDQTIGIEGFVREGFATDIIPEMAELKHSDVIVMGMKGKGKSHSVLGSTTTAIIRKTTIPVLVIPEQASYESIDKITFAADFNSDTEMGCYTLLQELAEKYHSLIQILNVQKDEQTMSRDEVIGKMKTSLIFSKIQHSYHTVGDHQVIRGISRFMQENPANMLVMTAHHHSVLERMFGMVLTKEMSYQTKIPLLVLHNEYRPEMAATG